MREQKPSSSPTGIVIKTDEYIQPLLEYDVFHKSTSKAMVSPRGIHGNAAEGTQLNRNRIHAMKQRYAVESKRESPRSSSIMLDMSCVSPICTTPQPIA
jgi:hypothetical protein